MISWYYWVGGIVVAFVIALIFEESREWLSEGFAYFISFEWLSDIGELFGSMFENISEISIFGLTFGIIGAGTIFFLRNYMLSPFTKFMSPFEAIFWTIVTYLGTFVVGYFVGKHFENTG